MEGLSPFETDTKDSDKNAKLDLYIDYHILFVLDRISAKISLMFSFLFNIPTGMEIYWTIV